MQADHRELLLQAYAAYNSQDVEALVALISDDVDLPDDDIGRLHSKDEVQAYWTEQWARTRTHDAPVGFSERNDGRTAVHISQVVRSLDRPVISKGRSCTYTALETWKYATTVAPSGAQTLGNRAR